MTPPKWGLNRADERAIALLRRAERRGVRGMTVEGAALILAMIFGPAILLDIGGLWVVGRRPVVGLIMLGVGTGWIVVAALFGVAR